MSSEGNTQLSDDGMPEDVVAARAAVRAALQAQRAAALEYDLAVHALHDAWMATYGSERYKMARFGDDLLVLRTETGSDR